MPCNDQGSVREADPLPSELNNSNKSIQRDKLVFERPTLCSDNR